jgi:hypothetical protein
MNISNFSRLYLLFCFPDYDITIYPLAEDDTHYTALNMNYSVAGFQAWTPFFEGLLSHRRPTRPLALCGR